VNGEMCGAPHPERPGVDCDRPPHGGAGFHRERASGTVWEADPLPGPGDVGRGGLAAMAARTARHHRTGPAAGALDAWKGHRAGGG
jgi:hypothetical protein